MPSTIQSQIRRGTYFDSLVLMQLQLALGKMPGIASAGVMMGVPVNKNLLQQNGLLTKEAEAASADDLIICVAGKDEAAVQSALSSVDDLLAARPLQLQQDYSPKTLRSAARLMPEANWVAISVPGQYATRIAREGLELGKNIFLYSDNVTIEDECSLKHKAASLGLLVMGPDCGTAIINGAGLGFANQVRPGNIGLLAASGTGLQLVTTHIHELGGGITHALGTGGRDLSEAVGGITAQQSLDLLSRDPQTEIIILISKPPSPGVAAKLLRMVGNSGKPVVINFLNHASPIGPKGADNLYFATSLEDAAGLAIELVRKKARTSPGSKSQTINRGKPGYLRGLFSGGTLAQEALQILQTYLPDISSNMSDRAGESSSGQSKGHRIIDLGEDQFTIGRPHPMLDNQLRLQLLEKESRDPEVAMILLDVVLGHGAHGNPAAELAPAIANARNLASKNGRELEVVAIIVGTDEDPQDLNSQIEQLQNAGARVERSNRNGACYAGARLRQLKHDSEDGPAPVNLSTLQQKVQVINLGLSSFAESLAAQKTPVLHVDWQPPAGDNANLLAILDRMKRK